LLERAAAEQEKNEPNQRVQIACSATGNNFENTLTVKRREPERDWDIEGEHALAQGKQRRFPIIRRAVNHDRQGKRQAHVIKQPMENRSAEAVQTEISGEAEQHDIAERKTGHADLHPLTFAERVGFARFQFAQRQRRFVTNRCQERDDFAQRNLLRRETNRRFAFEELLIPGCKRNRFSSNQTQAMQ
jgi:hypothetical protein